MDNLFLAAMIFPSNQDGSYSIPYKPLDVYAALINVLPKIDGFQVKSFSDLGLSIDVSVGMSWKSWGEMLQITILPSATGDALLNIKSKSKMGLVDWGKNKDNVNHILSGLQEELRNPKYIPVQASVQSIQAPAQRDGDPADKLLKLKALFDNHIICEEEYESRKEKLLKLL